MSKRAIKAKIKAAIEKTTKGKLSSEVEAQIDGDDDESVPTMTAAIRPLFDDLASVPYVEPLPAVSAVLRAVAECTPTEHGQVTLAEWGEWERGQGIEPQSAPGREYRRLRCVWNRETAREMRAKLEESRNRG